MAYKKILEEQANVDNPKYIAKYDKERDIIKIIIDGWGEQGLFTSDLELQHEEIEDFYYFIKEVKDLTV